VQDLLCSLFANQYIAWLKPSFAFQLQYYFTFRS
jgi:hypothetical protein